MKRLLIVLIIVSLSLVGCSTPQQVDSKVILSQKKTEEGRVPITINVKHAFTINTFEKEIEEKFSNVDLILIPNYSENLGISEYEARLKHDDLADIIITWPIDVGQEYLDDRLIDLSSYEFSNRYNVSMLDEIADDGKLYYLPGPAQVRGLVYNKTLFEEKGWDIPNNYDEFIALCHEIENDGIKPFQLGLKNKEVLDTAFIGFNIAEYYSDVQDRLWIENYNKGEGSFGDHFSGALDTFIEMIDEDIFTEEDLMVSYPIREDMLFSRKTAMVEDSVLLTTYNKQYGSTDEFALMPFFNKEEPSDWARIYMVCYIGLNKHLLDEGNKDKYDIVMDIMEYISTVEGQDVLAGDTGMMYSSLKGSTIEANERVTEIENALNQGRYTIFNELERANDGFREALEGLIKKEITKDEAIVIIDKANKEDTIIKEPTVIGKATEDFSLIETNNFITDLMLENTSADIALMIDLGKDGKRNARGLYGRLYKGDITTDDVDRIMPIPYHEGTDKIITVKLTGKEIIDTLERSVEIQGNTGWIYYFSGLNMEYSPTEKEGYRIKSISLSNGNPLELNEKYTVAIADKSINDQYIRNVVEYDLTIEELLVKGISEKTEISPAKDNRFIIVD